MIICVHISICAYQTWKYLNIYRCIKIMKLDKNTIILKYFKIMNTQNCEPTYLFLVHRDHYKLYL